MFETGTLWERIASVSAQAFRDGALRPIATERHTVVDCNVPFIVRMTSSDNLKPTADTNSNEGDRQNPFLPYDARLHVGDASPTHICLLNKFNVVPHHLLIVTSEFEHQQTPLSLCDFSALWRCMDEFEGLAFYNSGTMAGASQLHKHLQLVPLPLASTGPSIPIEVLLGTGNVPIGNNLSSGAVSVTDDNGSEPTGESSETNAASGSLKGCVIRDCGIPFPHAVVFWENDSEDWADRAAEESLRWYQEMIEVLGIGFSDTDPTLLAEPYNLLVTRRWMMMVRRQRECFHAISFNALAFAGALLVRDHTQLGQLTDAGPLRAIQSVIEPC